MITNFLNLKRRVMARVYLEYTKNVVLNYPDYFMFGIFVITSFVLVSIHDVFINTTGIIKNDYSAVLSFFISAIKNTSWIIQVLIAGFFVRVIIGSAILAYKNLNIKNRFFYSNV